MSSLPVVRSFPALYFDITQMSVCCVSRTAKCRSFSNPTYAVHNRESEYLVKRLDCCVQGQYLVKRLDCCVQGQYLVKRLDCCVQGQYLVKRLDCCVQGQVFRDCSKSD